MHLHGSNSTTIWSQLKIGAGGNITNIDFANDGTSVIRTDTFGAYKRVGSAWSLLTTSLSMPTGDFGHDASGNAWTDGAYEIAVAPSDSSRMWMFIFGKIFRSDNGGTTWVRNSNFAAVSNCNGNGAGSNIASRFAIDPANPDVCFAGTASNGLWKTVDAGATWTQISTASIPLATTSFTGVIVCYDNTSTVTGGKTQTLYASSYGNGVYKSTDGGATWTITTSTPTTHIKLICRNGVVWHVDASSFLRKYTGTWSAALPTDGSSGATSNRNICVDVDPANSSRIVAMMDNGAVSVSTNGGTSWCGFAGSGGPSGMTRSAGTGEPAWLAWTNEDYMGGNNIRFHPTNSNELWYAQGIGVWVSNPPDTAVANAWSAKAQGIEQLVANGVISPPSGVPLVFGWDRPIFRVSDPTAYPTTHGPNNTLAITHGASADWASTDPTCIVLISNYGGNSDQSAKSADGGQTWSLFAALPGGGLRSTFPGGMIAASTNQNYVWIGAQDSLTIYYTTNGGTSWSTGSITGPVTEGFSHNVLIDRQVLCADRVTANTFYLYYNGSTNSDGAGTNADGAIAGMYKSTNSGATWSKVFAGRLGNTGSANLDHDLGFYAARLRSVPNIASTSTAGHLFWTAGDKGGSVSGAFAYSINGGTNWTNVTGVLEVLDVGFGAPAPGNDYPTVFIVGWVGGTAESNYGVYRSTSTAAQWAANTQTWTKLTDYPYGNPDFVKCVSGDSATYGKVYVGFIGSGWAYGHL